MTIRARIQEWWRPTITYPALGELELRELPDAAAAARSSSPSRGLAHLIGHRDGIELSITTPSGLDIWLPPGNRMPVVEISNWLAWIDSLPELEPGSHRA